MMKNEMEEDDSNNNDPLPNPKNNDNNDNNHKRALDDIMCEGCLGGIGNSSKRPTFDTDLLMASEMNALSFDEREAVYEDIHGIARVVNETKDMVEESIQKLELELSKIRTKKAYDKAKFLSPRYVKMLRLMFLRAKEFQVRPAAELLVQYFERKLELFGPDKLVKVLTYEDLSPDDQEALKAGSTQCVPYRTDKNGRLVVFMHSSYHKYRHWMNLVRQYWYLMMTVLMNNEEAQKKGVVGVAYNLGAVEMDLALCRMGGRFVSGLPVRIAGFHFCMDHSNLSVAASILRLVIGVNTRLRFRVHFGSHTECLYELMTFGLPRFVLPVGEDGTLSTAEFDAFLARLQEKELMDLNENNAVVTTKSSNTDAVTSSSCPNNDKDVDAKDKKNNNENVIIYYPNSTDVLLGRGKPYQEHPGNQYWLKLIQNYRFSYLSADLGRKREVSNKVIEFIKAKGGRFLKRSDDGDLWVLVSDNVARDKIGQTFRFCSRTSTT